MEITIYCGANNIENKETNLGDSYFSLVNCVDFKKLLISRGKVLVHLIPRNHRKHQSLYMVNFMHAFLHI